MYGRVELGRGGGYKHMYIIGNLKSNHLGAHLCTYKGGPIHTPGDGGPRLCPVAKFATPPLGECVSVIVRVRAESTAKRPDGREGKVRLVEGRWRARWDVSLSQ